MGNEIAHWVVTVMTVIGLIVTLVRTNHHSSNNPTTPTTMALDSRIEDIKGMLNHRDYGLSALQQQISSFKEHCAGVSSKLTEQVINLDTRVRDIEQTRK